MPDTCPSAISHVPESLAPSLGLAVRDARRTRGWDARSLAQAGGLGVADVVMAEHGDAVTDDTAVALCAALGLDPTPHVRGMWRRPPRPADHRHLLDMQILDANARTRGGLVVHPDVATMRACEPPVSRPWHSEAWSAVADRIRVTDLVKGGLLAVFVGSLSLQALEGLGLDALGRSVVVLMACGGLGVALGAPVASLALGAWRGPRRGADVAARAYVLDGEGVTVIRVDEGWRVRESGLTGRVRRVGVLPHGQGHVSLTVEGDVGTLSLPWIARSADLAAAVGAWGVPVGARRDAAP